MVRHRNELPREVVWKCSRATWMWHVGMWFRVYYGGTMVMVGFGNLEDLFQAWGFCEIGARPGQQPWRAGEGTVGGDYVFLAWEQQQTALRSPV